MNNDVATPNQLITLKKLNSTLKILSYKAVQETGELAVWYEKEGNHHKFILFISPNGNFSLEHSLEESVHSMYQIFAPLFYGDLMDETSNQNG